MITREEYIEALEYAVQMHYEYGAQDEQHLALRLRDLADRMRRANKHWQGPYATNQISTWRVIGWKPVLILQLDEDDTKAGLIQPTKRSNLK